MAFHDTKTKFKRKIHKKDDYTVKELLKEYTNSMNELKEYHQKKLKEQRDLYKKKITKNEKLIKKYKEGYDCLQRLSL